MAHGRFGNLPPFLWTWFVGGKVNKKTWLRQLQKGGEEGDVLYERRMHKQSKEKGMHTQRKEKVSRVS